MAGAQVKAGIGILAAAVLLALTPTAQATYPGVNGKITFDVYTPDDNSDIWAIDPDGSNRMLLIDDGRHSAWASDGRRIAFTCPPDNRFYYNTCTAAANGAPVKHLENSGVGGQYRPSWSPDGKRLIIDDRVTGGHNPEEEYAELWRIDAADGGDPIRMVADGLSGSWSRNGRIAFSAIDPNTDNRVATVNATTPGFGTRLTESGADRWPDWSPDGTKIAFESYRNGSSEIWVMNSDGSNETQLLGGSKPVWSPDGTKILFESGSDLWVMNADGTGVVNLTNTPGVWEREAAWQPVRVTYVRPKGASPLRVSLVPAFEPCEEPNATHGSPLASGSCTPPRDRGGEGIAFGRSTGSSAVGYVRFTAIPGAPDTANNADVEISVNMTDVGRRSDGTDALGSLDLPVPLRLTDKGSGPVQEQGATVTDYNVGILGYGNNPLHFEVPCAQTADPAVGSTCSATTTVNALFPPNQGDAVKEGRRSIWELDQIAVWDGGEDGVAESRDDNTVFAVQGLFVP